MLCTCNHEDMKQTQHPVPYDIRAHLWEQWLRLRNQIVSPWTKALVLIMLFLLVTRQELNLSFSINGGSFLGTTQTAFIYDIPSDESAQNVSQLVSNPTIVSESIKSKPVTSTGKQWTAKQKRQLAYVAKYATVAQEEMRKNGVPASITLAQGLLESNIGKSSLATKNNNHFGIKCFSKQCKKGHCSNFSDDSHKDFFRVYTDAHASFQDHSRLLKKERYASLFKLKITDYKNWAKGLSKAGYATDPKYADKLIKLIKDLDLDKYDRR